MAKRPIRHTDLRIILKSGAAIDVHSDLGFVVEGNRVSEPEGAMVIPFLDPTAVAMVHSVSAGRLDRSLICPNPRCVAVIDGPWWACREHWYALPTSLRELVITSNRMLEQNPTSERMKRGAESARQKALDYWERNPAPAGDRSGT